MSRITDYILEPKVVYTDGGFLVRVKVIDDYKYKKYIVSENLHYKTVQGTSFTLTDASSTKQASILELKGNTTQEGTPTPSSPVEVKTVSGDNNIVIQNKNLLANDIWEVGTISGTTGQNNNANNKIRTIGYVRVKPNTTYTLFIDQDTTTTAFVFEYDKQYSNFHRIPSTWTTMPFTFTTRSTTEYIRVLFGASTISTAEKVQLEQNNQESSYLLHEETKYNVSLGGKNKCITDYKEWEVGGYGTSGNKEDVQSRARVKELIPIKPDQTYYIDSFNSNYKFVLRGYRSDKTFIMNYGAINNGGTITTKTSNGTLIYYLGITIYNPNNTSSTEGQNIINKIQSEDIKPFICLNSIEDKTFTPYNPIELCKIGNYQDKLLQSTGKNLVPSPSFDKPWGISGSGDTRTITTNAIYKNRAEIVPINSNSTYTISGDFSMMTNNMIRILMFDSLPDVGSVSTKYVYNTSPYTFTTDTNTKYLLLFNSENIDTTSNNIMIEQGDQATSPEPYGIGKWYIEKNIGKVVLNGSENWNVNKTGTANWYYQLQNAVTNFNFDSGNTNYFTNIGVKGIVENTNTTQGVYILSTSELRVRYGTEDTVANWKAFLGTTNMLLYYPLLTPTYTEITDTYLLNQLNGIQDIELYENLCYVDWIGSIKPTMTLQYAGTEDLGIKYIITENGKKIRTDWRKLGRRKKWKMK